MLRNTRQNRFGRRQDEAWNRGKKMRDLKAKAERIHLKERKDRMDGIEKRHAENRKRSAKRRAAKKLTFTGVGR